MQTLPLSPLVGTRSFSPPSPFFLRDSLTSSPTIDSLVRDHFQLVWRTLKRFGLSEADADDGAQEVFLIIHKKLEAISPGREKSYLVSVARRVAATRRRSLARRREDGAIDTGAHASDANSPEEVTSLREAREHLEVILSRMPDEVREVFVLFELERFTGPEIVQALDLPEGTVNTRLRRGREIFRVAAGRLVAKNSGHEGGADDV